MTASAHPLLPNLPMQLMLTLGCWLSSPFVLRCVKSALPPLSLAESSLPPLSAEALSQLEHAVYEEAKSRSRDLLTGLIRYQETGYQRRVTEPSAIWQRGSARLLDYSLMSGGRPYSADSRLVLFVPSLINRYYVLDLEEDRSMLRYLASQGLHPLVLDWGVPGALEQDYGCEEYISELLVPAIEYLHRLSRQKIVVAGYCMGGVLSLAAAQLRPRLLAGLALLATPWDFYCDAFAPFVVARKWRSVLRAWVEEQPQMAADAVQMLFYLADPWIFEQKFRRYATLQPDSRAARDFVALEHWVNDGIPLNRKVARECLIGWAQENILARGKWQVAGKMVDPARLHMPVLLAIPKNDHVVPLQCAMPLASSIPHSQLIHPGAGHVGMIVGSSARRELWHQFLGWVGSLSD